MSSESTSGSDKFIAFVKAECDTCVMVQPVLAELLAAGVDLTVYTQDDPAFPVDIDSTDDRSLEQSFHFDIETMMTMPCKG